nr:FeoA family protein [uncultured Sphaerochaeta sp.]
MTIANCKLHTEYLVASIMTTEVDMQEFLFTLGCYPGERIVLISRLPSMYVVDIKNSRYSIDEDLARAICLEKLERSAKPTLASRVV